MASHALGMVELAASVREQHRQMKLARSRGGVFIDALTGLQVDERAAYDACSRSSSVSPPAPRRLPAAGGARQASSGAATMPERQPVGGRDEAVDDRVPRRHHPDPRSVDAPRGHLSAPPARTTCSPPDTTAFSSLTSSPNGRSGTDSPARCALPDQRAALARPATRGPLIEIDAIEFCRALYGRAHADGLLPSRSRSRPRSPLAGRGRARTQMRTRRPRRHRGQCAAVQVPLARGRGR